MHLCVYKSFLVELLVFFIASIIYIPKHIFHIILSKMIDPFIYHSQFGIQYNSVDMSLLGKVM